MKAILSLILPFLSVYIYAQKSQPELLDSLFTSLHEKNSFNGNVLIADKGKVIFEKSYGLANEATGQKLDLETKFELASVSKQFTAMGIVLLEKQGRLQYDDPVSKYIPELSFYGNITIRNLLHHTGGLPDYMELFEEKWDKSGFATNQDIVNEFAKFRPEALFAPGEKFAYSNTGYALLGLIVERVSGKPYEQFLAEHIFMPLGMKNTFVYRSRFRPQKVDNYALGYVLDSSGNKVLTDNFGKEFYTYYLDGIVGDGMVNSTLGDLLKWDRALYTDRLVNSKDREVIFSPIRTTNGKNSRYGFGFVISHHDLYGKMAWHSGGWAGYITYLERHMDNDKTIIILQNNETAKTATPVTEVRKILYNEKLEAESLQPAILASEDLDKYLGVYSSEELSQKITISKDGNTLMAQATGQAAFPLDAFEGHIFTFEPANIKMVFNPANKVMELMQGGSRLVFTKE